MYKVIIHPDAQKDKKNIYSYLFDITWTSYYSDKIIKQIYEKYLYLKLFPFIFPITYKNYRTINIKTYSIYYVINKDKKEVTIIRIFWIKQNFKNYI